MNKSTHACSEQLWHLEIWDPQDPLHTHKRLPWNCRSWRHAGHCRRWKGSQDFARVLVALKTFSPWVYIVLTFDHSARKDPFTEYRDGLACWSKLRKRFAREWGPNRYIQTWERNQGGGCHVNIAINCGEFYKESVANWRLVRSCWLKPHAVACGFGYICWLKPMYGAEGLAGYLTKLSRELTCADGKDQIPVDAPPHFRRIRASQKTLPPPNKTVLTGRLNMSTLESWASIQLDTVSSPEKTKVLEGVR